MSKDRNVPKDLDEKIDSLSGVVKVSMLIIAKAIAEDETVWLTSLATDDGLREHVKKFVELFTNDLETVEKVRLKMSDWL